MSNESESKFDLDLHFLPAWAQQSSTVNRFADYEGETEDRFERRRGDRGPRRGRREGGPRRDRPPEGQRGPRREPMGDGSARGERGERFRRPERREPAPELPALEVSILPEEKGVEALARQIRLTGRAYPLFDIAQLILKRPERYVVRANVIKKPEGQTAQPLFLCAIDETLWLAEAEAMSYVLGKHFATFYQAEKIPADPPKGVFTFVAQCGMSGTVLGPPNYHDYQNKLRKLHAERYSHLPFEVYKSRVKIVRDEAVVKKWIEDQSFSTQYLCLNVAESLKLANREEVERHFREVHLANVIQSVETYTLSGVAAGALPCQPLRALTRRAYEEQRRFPLKLAMALSQMFARQGLQFFKVNKTLTHVAVSRPHYLDVNVTPVSDGIKQILSFINAHPDCNRRALLEALAPAPVLAAPTPAAAAGTTEAAPPTEAPAAPEAAPPTPEMNAVTSDLHWLIHQGHVIEFANGNLEVAKMPPPKPPRPLPAKPEESAVPAPSPETEGSADVSPPTTDAPSAAVLEEEPAGPALPAESPISEPAVPPPSEPGPTAELAMPVGETLTPGESGTSNPPPPPDALACPNSQVR